LRGAIVDFKNNILLKNKNKMALLVHKSLLKLRGTLALFQDIKKKNEKEGIY
jgi:hypothetical protein